MSESPHIVADGLKNLKDFVTSFDEISTAAVFNIVRLPLLFRMMCFLLLLIW